MLTSAPQLSRLTLWFLSLLGLLAHVSALDVKYCSSLNTADTGRNSSIYQSNGLCYDFCSKDYAFAVVQNQSCWCSNYAPGSTSDGCTLPCPGYPTELCGAANLYGYIALPNAPSGTRGGSGASSTTVQSTSSIREQSTTTTGPPTTSSSGSSSTTWTPTPVISLETVTGSVRTVTVTPTVPPNSEIMGGIREDSSGGGLGTGGIVGLTIGLVALIALVAAIIFFCLRKRRQEKAEEYNTVSRRGSSTGLGGTGTGPVPSRTMSENSRYVLGTDGRQVVEAWENDGGRENAPGTRRSRLMPVDPRLDPFAPVYQRGENKSRESVNTLRDDHDYSRRVHNQGPILRATNPDE